MMMKLKNMTLSPQVILAIGAGGFVGAITRAYIVSFFNKTLALNFPFGVLFVNIAGSLLIGMFFAIFSYYTVNDSLKSFINTGFLGALTTYSAFAIESFLLLETSFLLGLYNMFFNLVGSVLAAGLTYKFFYFILNNIK